MSDEASQSLAETVALLRNREEIRDVLHRYCRATDRADVELLKSCYHSDAVDFHGSAFSGNAHEFAEHVLSPENLGALADVRHYITNTMIEFDGIGRSWRARSCARSRSMCPRAVRSTPSWRGTASTCSSGVRGSGGSSGG